MKSFLATTLPEINIGYVVSLMVLAFGGLWKLFNLLIAKSDQEKKDLWEKLNATEEELKELQNRHIEKLEAANKKLVEANDKLLNSKTGST